MMTYQNGSKKTTLKNSEVQYENSDTYGKSQLERFNEHTR